MRTYWQTLQAFSPGLRCFLLGWAIAATVFFGLQAVLQNLFLLRLGFDARFIGLLVAVGQFVWAAAALPAGALGNRIGLRKGMLLGFVLSGLGLALLLLVERWPAPYWRVWLMSSQAAMNAGVALNSVVMAPYLMAVTRDAERPHAFAALQALIPTGALVGSLLAGVLPGLWAYWLGTTLGEAAPYRMALWLGPALLGLGLLPLLRADPAPVADQTAQHVDSQTGAARLPLGLLVGFTGVAFLGAVGGSTVYTFFNVYLDRGLGVPPAAIGMLMGLAQLLPIGVALAMPPLLARWGSGYTLGAGLLGLALWLLPLALVPVLGVAALAYVGIGAALTITNTARDYFGQGLVAPRWRTTIQGVAMLGMASGGMVAGVGGGVLIDTLGFGALFVAGALAALLAAGLLMGYLRATGRHVAQPADRTPVLP